MHGRNKSLCETNQALEIHTTFSVDTWFAFVST